ncbi:MAG: ATP-binding cassette domain-containing protein, partial [Bacteroidota bacterium]
DTFLINASVHENLKYGCSDASDEDVYEAARQANALDFILNLPQGFETPIGDRGVLLSGGQRQRISIARALLQNPEILILDEATSALDTVSEKLIQEALESLRREKTTLVIAHRLSTVRNADVIMVLESGKVIESGTHESLVALGGKYSELCSMQSSSENNIYKDQSDQDASYSVPYADVSYQVRSELNKMSGVLGLLEEDSFENSSDYRLLINTFKELTSSVIASFEFMRRAYDKR